MAHEFISFFLTYPAADGLSRGPGDTNLLDGYVITASFNSSPVFVGRHGGFSVLVSCPSTGTPVGTVKIQGSNDVRANNLHSQSLPDSGLTHWVDMGFVDPTTGSWITTQAISSATTVGFEGDTKYAWIRMVYTKTSGTCTLTARMGLQER